MDRKTLENIMEITSLFEFHNALGKFKECNEPVSYFDQLKSSIENWAAEFEEHFDEDTMDLILDIANSYSDIKKSRQKLISKYGPDYFETNLENILIDYLVKSI